MKYAGFACLLTVLAGLTGFNTPAQSQLPPPTVRAGAALPQEAPQRQSSRRSSRNRYPGPIPTSEDWEPPEGPVKIALQAGHWRSNEAPAELSGIRGNGTRWGSLPEWEANLAIAQRASALLEELGYEVEILPAVVPPDYRAHLFISIHADGSNDAGASGFRVAAPRQDATGRASDFVELLERSYGEETNLRLLPAVTHRMQRYYAFNYRRYEHALHPMTIGVILETGFMTSPGDRTVIVDDPERAARGIVEAVKAYPVTPPPADTIPREPEVRQLSQPLFEEGLRDHHVDPDFLVDELGDPQIAGHTQELIGGSTLEPEFISQQGDGFSDGDGCGFSQILVGAHGDVVSRGLAPGPVQAHILAHDQLKTTS